MNERNAQLQKQLDNVIREGCLTICILCYWFLTLHAANSEIALMNSKVQGLEKELEMERRKIRELQDSTRERDKEYQKLKVRYRKNIFAPFF